MPNTHEKWVDFDRGKPETHPEDGSRIMVALGCGLKGPAIYHSRTGFALFNAPWMDLGSVEQWHYKDWMKRPLRTT
jgi:hypothetical protein